MIVMTITSDIHLQEMVTWIPKYTYSEVGPGYHDLFMVQHLFN